jgi:hypothetical protein
VEEALQDTPVVVIQGARQVGKSTLARQVLAGRDTRLVNLDVAIERDAALRDPDAFVRRVPAGLLAIDEVQRAPGLLLAVKAAVDEDRRPGRFLLTGSADLVSMRRNADSLAGRAETVVLYGLSQGEVTAGPDRLTDVLFTGEESRLAAFHSDLTRQDYTERACLGAFPEARGRHDRRRQVWFDNYLDRIVSRDARDLTSSPYLDRLPRLVRVLAANTAGELVRARVARDAEIPETTLESYVQLLVDMFVVHRVPAWGRNLTVRVVGRPKVALLDTGLAARLGNLSPNGLDGGQAADHAGPLLETFVAAELRRQQSWAGTRFELFHFRDRSGREVDLMLEDDARRVVAVEVKATTRIRPGDQRGLEFLRDSLGQRFVMGVVLHTGPDTVRIGDRLWALPIEALWRL